MSVRHRLPTILFGIALVALAVPRAASAASTPRPEPIRLSVDLTGAPDRVLHARLTFPVRPGEVTLFYPKWIPGEHGPTGPIANLAGLVVSAHGTPLEWKRDLVEMYAIHVVVPPGARTLDVAFDFLLSSDLGGFTQGASATTNLAVLNWNQVLFYPIGTPLGDLTYVASIKLPAGWRYGTALPVARESGGWVEFKPAPLVTLVDSPVNAGRWFREVPLAPEITPRHYLDLVGDSREAIDLSPDKEEEFSRLVREARQLFGAHHYRDYHFLYTLSDHVPFFGLEHHESSDNRAKERSLIDKDAWLRTADLLPHEFAHSWNGKYRRPADLATPDYQTPMKTDLLWVYEGLTQYLGWILASRSGILTPEQARDYLAETAAALDNEPGRTWRPLLDTAVSAQFLYGAGYEGSSWRRGVDFYDESLLFWLEADTIIRSESKGQRSLDDFCRRFHGSPSSGPEVKPYTLEDIVATMNEVQPHDWKSFFTERVTRVRARAPLDGITRGGWKVTYSDSATAYQKSLESAGKRLDFRYSVGLYLTDEGQVLDVWPRSPAAKAGLAPGMKLFAVNGKQWTDDVMHDAIRTARRSHAPMEVLAKNGDFYATYRIEYTGGERFARLTRVEGVPDLLDENLTPLAPPARSASR
jgi:predicted metalloprotease with PDZ domain